MSLNVFLPGRRLAAWCVSHPAHLIILDEQTRLG
jgi:hypothetical protein